MKRPDLKTFQNLEAAFAGESMAHIKYRYFAKLARAAGDDATARVFEETADQEVQHAFGHLDLLYPSDEITPAKARKRFTALAKVEERHANRYRAQLESIEGSR
jgi:rubrerythrin